MSDEFDKAVHQTLPKPPVLGDKPTQAESAGKTSQKEEAMEVGTEEPQPLPSRPPVKETERKENQTGEKGRNQGSWPTSGSDRRGETEGHKAPTGAPRTLESSSGLADKHGPARQIAATVWQRAGGLKPPGQELGAISRDDWNQPRWADWSIDSFQPPDWIMPPPCGSTLGEAPVDATEIWEPRSDILPAELHRYLQGIAQQGHQDSAHIQYGYYLQYQQDSMEARRSYENNLRTMKDHKAFVDADLAGVMMATIKDLQCKQVAALKVANEAHQQSRRINTLNSQLVKDKEALEKKLAASEEVHAAAKERVTTVEQRQAECTSPS